ncbi:hypothetical protein ACP4OV_017138 [Aristida adscensionis]
MPYLPCEMRAAIRFGEHQYSIACAIYVRRVRDGLRHARTESMSILDSNHALRLRRMAAPAGLNAKRCILAALAATVAAATLVVVVFVVMSPPHVRLSVVRLDRRRVSGEAPASDGGVRLSLTLAARNPSRRAAVEYDSMLVEASNSSTGAGAGGGEQPLGFNVTTATPLRQPTGNVTTTVEASVFLPDDDVPRWLEDDLSNSTLAVVFTAAAHFKVGVARTRMYEIYATCDKFNAGQRLPIECNTTIS